MRVFSGNSRVAGVIVHAVFLLALSLPCIVLAESRPDKQFGDWRTFVFTGNNSVYGMYCQDANSKDVELQMGKFNGSCNNTKVYVTVGFSQPATKDYARKDIAGEVRVDQHPVHKTVSRLSYKAGDKGTGYDVHSFENPQNLLQEMASGQVIRFKFNLDNQEYYYRFPLNGFGPSYDRITQLCAQAAKGGERPAKPAPGSKPRQPKGDSDFFDSPSPSGDKGSKPGNNTKTDKDFF